MPSAFDKTEEVNNKELINKQALYFVAEYNSGARAANSVAITMLWQLYYHSLARVVSLMRRQCSLLMPTFYCSANR